MTDSLSHFGVRGMHWGVNRERAANGRVSGKSEPLPQHKDFSNRAKGSAEANYGAKGAARINESMHKGLSIDQARAKERGIREEASRTSGLKPIGNLVTGAAVGATVANVSIRAARAAAYSPTTLKVMGGIFKNAPFGVKALAANSVIGARLLTDVAASPMVKQAITWTAGYEGAKKGYKLTESYYQNKAVKNAEKKGGS